MSKDEADEALEDWIRDRVVEALEPLRREMRRPVWRNGNEASNAQAHAEQRNELSEADED